MLISYPRLTETA